MTCGVQFNGKAGKINATFKTKKDAEEYVEKLRLEKVGKANKIHHEPLVPDEGTTELLRPLDIHRDFGVEDIPGIKMLGYYIKPTTTKKYEIRIEYQGKQHRIKFGDPKYQQYHDRMPEPAFADKNHGDEDRRRSYLARSSKIRNKNGELTCNDPFSPNRYSILLLW